jgi:hypothetical protein
MQKIINTLVFFMVIIFFMTTCDKDAPVEDPPVMPQDTTFCGYIDAERFDSIYAIMNKKIMTFSFSDDKYLDKIEEWLLQFDCVVDVKWYCCILTIPLEIEANMKVETKDGFLLVYFRIADSDPLKLQEVRKF